MGLKIGEKTIRVLLIDDHPVVRRGIAILLEEEDDIEVCGEAENAEEALRQIQRLEPDIALVDIHLKGSASGIDLIKAIWERYPKVKSLVLSMHEEPTYVERAMKAGAKGYLPKSEAPKKIIDAIRDVHRGELSLSKSVSDKIINKLFHGPAGSSETNVDILSNREFEVFQLIGNGHKTSEIADKLNLSKHTIESHRRNIKEKLRIKSSSDLIKTAAQWLITQNQ